MKPVMKFFRPTLFVLALSCTFTCAEEPADTRALWELGFGQTLEAAPPQTQGNQLIEVAEGLRQETVRSTFLNTFAAPNVDRVQPQSDGSEFVAAQRARRFVRLGILLRDEGADEATALQEKIRHTENRMLRMTEREREKLINPATNQQYTDRDLNAAYERALERQRRGEIAVPEPTPIPPTPTPTPESAQGTGMVWPVANSAAMGDGFGPRGTHPVTGAPNAMHRGIDFSGPTGTPIYASLGGTIIQSKSDCTIGDHRCGGGWGNHIIIDHGNGLKTVYAHLSTLNFTAGPVSKGDVIAGMGDTGSSTDPHLHFEVWKDDVRVDPLGHLPTR